MRADIAGIPSAIDGHRAGQPGQYQINVAIPSGVPAADDVPIEVSMPGGSSDTVTIAVTN